MHVDSSGYRWGAILDETTDASGFWYDRDREVHITYKELKASKLVGAIRLRSLQYLTFSHVVLQLPYI